MKNIKYIALSLFAGAAITSCSISKTLVNSGEYDDMYGTSSDAPVAYAPTVAKSSEAYAPEYLIDYNDSYDRMPADSSIEGTDTYFDENYVSANSLKRAYTPDAGYTSGYAEGYAEGWSDYAWSGSRNFGRWNSFNNPFGGFGYNSFGFNSFGYSPFNSGFGSYLGMGSLAYGGFYGLNSFGYSPWGMNSFGYSPYGFNSFGYSPWGYSSYGMYGNGFGNPYYGVQPVLANDSRYSGNRSYGPRSSSGRASSIYNDGFVNTRKPVATASSARRSTGTSTSDARSAIASRANGRTYTTASNRPTSYDAYRRNSSRSVSTRSASNSGLNRTTSASPRSSANTYSRTATRARSYTPSSSSSSSNSGYSRSSSPTRSNSGYSRPASTSSTRSASPSAGGYSRGSSSSSSSSSRSSSSSARPR